MGQIQTKFLTFIVTDFIISTGYQKEAGLINCFLFCILVNEAVYFENVMKTCV